MSGHWTALWRSLWTPQPRGWQDRMIALLLAAIYLPWLLTTADALGYARDEGFYFQAADRYQQWFQLLAANPASAFANVDRYWVVNHEHPALIKSLFALSHLLHQKLALFELEGTSYRFPAMLLASLGIGLLYLWGARSTGRLTGLLAACWLAAMPRFFFHAHLACFDVPIVTMWLLCAYCYWRSLQRADWTSHLLCGIAFGLALNTKHNSWFLPIVCMGHAASLWLPGLVPRAQRMLMLRRAFRSLACMAAVGPLLCYALWPWIWHDTLPRLREYATFHLGHVYYNMEFLGRNYFRPPMPRAYAFVMTVATVPLVPLVSFLLGALAAAIAALRWGLQHLPSAWRRLPSARRRSSSRECKNESLGAVTSMFWWLAVAVQYAAWLRPGTPIFGGTKHWLAAYPFMLLIGARFAAEALRVVVGWGLASRPAMEAPPSSSEPSAARLELPYELAPSTKVSARLFLATALLIAPAVVQTQRSGAWGLSWYSALVGGAEGAASLGLNRGFWGYSTLVLAEHINRRMPPGGRIYIHDTAHQAWNMLVREGRIRKDLRLASSPAGVDMAIYHHERHMAGVEYQQWDALGSTAPAVVAGIDGVPVIWLYESPRLAGSR